MRERCQLYMGNLETKIDWFWPVIPKYLRLTFSRVYFILSRKEATLKMKKRMCQELGPFQHHDRISLVQGTLPLEFRTVIHNLGQFKTLRVPRSKRQRRANLSIWQYFNEVLLQKMFSLRLWWTLFIRNIHMFVQRMTRETWEPVSGRDNAANFPSLFVLPLGARILTTGFQV